MALVNYDPHRALAVGGAGAAIGGAVAAYQNSQVAYRLGQAFDGAMRYVRQRRSGPSAGTRSQTASAARTRPYIKTMKRIGTRKRSRREGPRNPDPNDFLRGKGSLNPTRSATMANKRARRTKRPMKRKGRPLRRKTQKRSRRGLGSSKPKQIGNPSHDFTRSKNTSGRYQSETLKKLLKASEQKYVFRYQQLTAFDNATSGAHFIYSSRTGTPALQRLPIAVYNIDMITQTLSPFPFIRPELTDDATRAVQWFSIPGVTPGGAATSALQVEEYPVGGATGTDVGVNNLGSNAVHRWFEAKLLLYSPANVPCRVLIQVITINKWWLHPEVEIGPTAEQQLHRYSFWSHMGSSFTWNPLHTNDSKTYQKDYKVHKSWTYTTEPKLSVEPGSLGHIKQFSMFLKLNKTKRYDWNPQYLAPDMPTDDNETWTQRVGYTGVNRNSVAPNKRMYFVIRAQSSNLTTLTPLKSDHLSFDFRFRSCHVKYT